MRVIGGQFRSRRLLAPQGIATRPTSDRLRETLFNVLGPKLAGARFVDLYAGSGAVGLEALSRGAASCVFVERAPAAVAVIRQNLQSLGIAGGARVDGRSVPRALEDLAGNRQAFHFVFLDPPYEALGDYEATLRSLGTDCSSVLAPGAVVVAEHARRATLPEQIGKLVRTRLLEQGDGALSFYSNNTAATEI